MSSAHTNKNLATYTGLKYQSTTLAPVYDENHIEFLIGTRSLREENEIHLVEYIEEKNEIICNRILDHKPEIWSLSSCNWDPSLLITGYNTGMEFAGSLWRIKTQEEREKAGDFSDMEKLVDFNGFNGRIKSILFDPTGENKEKVISVDERSIQIWNLNKNEKEKEAKLDNKINVGELEVITASAWDFLQPHQFATSNESSLRIWDLRTLKETQEIEHAQGGAIRDLAFNRNKPWHIATAGDDFLINFWDLRNTKEFVYQNKQPQALITLAGHSHWVWNIEFNPIYDQLLLSSSTDSTVKLWNVPSFAFELLLEDEDESDKTRLSRGNRRRQKSARSKRQGHDGLAKSYDSHEDSVYAISWSPFEPWIFASVSYDGKLVVSHVPEKLKDEISLN
ncbi:earp and garp complex-interacting protein [Anaeramoeba ignava]|uniref:Earp and garp complex-interacting protein n=1 Tax=Anaeramoeba ignava TaxID=1746090 RepID=A0A9Q0L971_ANAIG|nr:earp and garp complex-interacting protein [Anaeramoeba ignava]